MIETCAAPTGPFLLAEAFLIVIAIGVAFVAGGVVVWWRMTATRRSW